MIQLACPVCQQPAFVTDTTTVESYNNIWIHEECRIGFMTLIMEFYAHPAHEEGQFGLWVEKLFYFTKSRQESPL